MPQASRPSPRTTAWANVVETFDTATGTQMKANWTVATYDAMSRDLTQTTKLSDVNGAATTASVETITYDGNGQELTSNDSTIGGQAARTVYDADGNAIEEWDEGVANYATAGNSTQSGYDTEGNLLFESEVGNPAAPETDAGAAEMTYDTPATPSEELPDGSKEEGNARRPRQRDQIEAVPPTLGRLRALCERDRLRRRRPAGLEHGSDDSHKGLTVDTSVTCSGRERPARRQARGITTIATRPPTPPPLGARDDRCERGHDRQTPTTCTATPVCTRWLQERRVTRTSDQRPPSSASPTGRHQGRDTYDAFGNMTRSSTRLDGADLSDVVTTSRLARPVPRPGRRRLRHLRSWTYR